MIHGSCMCGGIRFEIEKVRAMTYCHCSVCRKTTGASVATFAHVRSERFKLLSGEDLINPGIRMDSWPCTGLLQPLRLARSGIRQCDRDGERSGRPIGGRPERTPFDARIHVVESRWIDLDDDLPKYEKWVPGFVPEDLASTTKS